MGEKLFLMKFPTIGQVHFDSIGVEVRKWGTSGVKFQNEKYTLLLAEGLQIWVAVLFLRRFYDIIIPQTQAFVKCFFQKSPFIPIYKAQASHPPSHTA